MKPSKESKLNKVKIADLQAKIATNSANTNIETLLYGPETQNKINEWLQSCTDLSQENIRLLVAIARTNLSTQVTITLGGKTVTKSIAEWVWRRREYASLDLATWSRLTDRNLREGQIPPSPGATPFEVKIIRHYDPVKRDYMVAMFKSEPHEIDASLEIINAVTDLMES